MIRVGITGQAGFIGTHLYNYLGLFKDDVERIPFLDSFFEDSAVLAQFVKQCDVIVHLAAVNRHADSGILYETNIDLTNKLISATDAVQNYPHIIFSSSTQEDRDNLYGKSKKECRNLFELWANRTAGKFTGLVIPNVFGPFGSPRYNSVIATFAYQLTHAELPVIDTDGLIKLIYVNDLVSIIYSIIKGTITPNPYYIPHNKEIKVSEILRLLNEYYELYFKQGIISSLRDNFEISLFNTFRSYIDNKAFYPVGLLKREDNRGYLVETIKEMTGGQSFFSMTNPGITRGNHFHTRKIERFCVIKGKGLIKLRRIGTEEVLEFYVDGEIPCFVDMPIWYTHNITNVGDAEMLTLFWTNEIFDVNDSDTFFEAV